VSQVSVNRLAKSPRRLLCTGLLLVATALPLAGCTEVETESSTAYEPSTLKEVKGKEDLHLVTFTEEGAKRVGVKTGEIRRDDGQTVVPYAALIYDPEGKTYVYTSPKPLTYVRAAVKVRRIKGQQAIVSDGLPAGTDVVTTGAAEVYGTELEVASH
jgi:hypothetical protein